MADQIIQCPSTCTVTVVHTFTVETPDFAAIGVTPETVLHAFGWGFAAVFSLWAIGYCVSVALGLIRKA